MKPRIRKKGKDNKGNTIFIIEGEIEGKLCTKVLNPSKLWTMLKSPKITKEKTK